MRYLLDTNAWVDHLNGRHPEVTRRIRSLSPADLCLNSVVVAGLRYGATKSQKEARESCPSRYPGREVQCLDFDVNAARTFGRVRAELEHGGRLIGPYDTLIVEHALSERLVLVTDNVREFQRVKGLEIENWRGAVGTK